VDTVKMWFAVKGVETEGWVQLPTIRQDIRQMRCPDCERVQQEEMERSMKDWETLEG
jgi:hypothetical protein